ncbi:MAG: 5-bromo-4-chloroindolyl phosphate hydrolysis family protein [Clostridium sp.]|jgi:hypothetical protein|nr:5-bromo-4-chloroindolyl phosphate hydrolysis family protein [Clostridium sp.]
MSEKQNRANTGEQIKSAVADALKTGDFKELNEVVASTVKPALEEVRSQVKTFAADVKQAGKTVSQNAKTASEKMGANVFSTKATDFIRSPQFRDTFHYKKTQGEKNPFRDTFHYKKTEASGRSSTGSRWVPRTARMSAAAVSGIRMKRKGRVLGVLFIVFGMIGLIRTGTVIVAELPHLARWGFGSWDFVSAAIWLVISLFLVEQGSVKRKRLKRAGRYVQISGGKTYVDIADLAGHTRRSRQSVLRDLEKMMKLEIFPEGHLDEQKSCFMFNDATYQEYLRVVKERRLLEAQGKADGNPTPKTGKRDDGQAGTKPEEAGGAKAADAETMAQVESVVSEGQECIRRLRELNDDIPGEVISGKLFRLEKLLLQIFDRIREQPVQVSQLHKFMEYYLPTTLKLIQAYAEFDRVAAPGEDISVAKTEIEKTMDTINRAFSELLNNLYRDAVFDATTDAQVLQTMLTREGLTKEMAKPE